MLEKEIKLITILTGDAPSQHNDQPVTLFGTISPARFIEGRKDDLQFKKHCMVSKRTDLSNFFLNEQSVVDRYIIQGL
jgi:hypothetical protein